MTIQANDAGGVTHRLGDLIDLKAVQNMADSHFKATGIPIGVIDAFDNSVLVGAGWQDICVNFHRANPETLKRCEESDNFIKSNLTEDSPCHYKCLNGLWDIGMPIIVKGQHLATLFLGQFFYEGEIPDRRFFIDQARQFNFNEKDYLDALFHVPVFTREKVQLILEYDIALIGFITELAEKALHEKQAEAEQKILKARLEQAQKLESIGRLAGGIAHDFNNMLGVIMGQVELSLLDLDPDSRLHADLKKIYKAACHSADLTRQLLAFARKQVISPRIVNLTETIDSMIKMLHRLLGENIDFKWLPETDVWPVKVDPVQIQQILANLCLNARDAIVDTGVITLEVENRMVKVSQIIGLDEMSRGDYVMISVSDTGRGMDDATVEHIFEPFYTSKPIGEGTGLGLATVYGIVSQNRGFIKVNSKPGHGTTFQIYFPRHDGPLDEQKQQKPPEPVPRGREIVLVVEDDSDILTIATRILKSLDYTVLTSKKPKEAVGLAEREQAAIDLLITDVIMPQMSGPELAGEILKVHPNCKVLYMSGYTADIIGQHGVLKEDIHFIQKPFTVRGLGERVREVLTST